MATVNVNRSVTDAFYRYKMPKLVAKVEGKGNGIKTVIVNMVEVAKAIGRPPSYPTKYFGCELGAQTKLDHKNDRYIVNGSHDVTKLQDLLDGFIRKFVLCPECDNPETDLIISAKKGTIQQGCKACGFHGLLTFNHKLNTFILKNPPNLNPAVQGSSLTEGKRPKRISKKQESNGDMTKSDEENDPSVQVPEAVSDEVDDEDDGGWSADISEEAVRARALDLSSGVKGLTISEDLEKTEKERMDIFYSCVKSALEKNTLDAKELLSEAERLEVKTKAPLILAELLFDEKIHVQLKKHRILLLRFTHEDTKAQRYLLNGVEQVFALHKESLLSKVPAILKLFYDADILDEKVLLEWAEKTSKKYVTKELSAEIRQRAEPFIRWLREAEEEESDSEESDDDLEIEYNDRARVTLQKETIKPTITKKADDDDENDVDIDNI
uniref:Eukaryotic translation initiation factor 5 n=1 Tax=Cacopsylla melanoneura TaxID=428564 RepID=A0A8D8U002_9HEMI